MRIDVRKFLFVGTKSRLDSFLDAMQAVGRTQFVTKPKPLPDLMGPQIYDMSRAVKILAHYGDGRKECSSGDERKLTVRNPFSFSAEILRMNDELERIHGQLKTLDAMVLVSQFFGEIPWWDIEYIESHSSARLRFFEASSSRQFDEQISALLPIDEKAEKSYYVSFFFTPPHLPPGLREVHRDELKELAAKREHFRSRQRELEEYLRRKSHDRESLRQAVLKEVSRARFHEAKATHQRELDDTIFTMIGWIPDSSRDEVSRIAAKYDVICEEVVPGPNETPPTYLENTKLGRVGEDLVSIYDTPSNADKDPSWWVLAFFILFFAMIVGDAGYGLVFLAIAIYYKIKGVASALAKRVVTLVGLLGVGCVIWGLLCHSIFGISLSEKNTLRRSSLLTYVVEKRAAYQFDRGTSDQDMQQWIERHNGRVPTSQEEFLYLPDNRDVILSEKYADNALFEVALFFGIIHIILGMGRYISKNPAYAGWILFLIGAYLYMPSYLGAISFTTYLFGVSPVLGAKVGTSLMLWGGGGALLYAVLRHGFLGIFEGMVAVQLFADTLSYLRLYALALAGALVAKISNQQAADLPMVVGVVLIIGAHAINIVLSVVGGIIHGLRLNFLEWYHYSFEGGGKKFTPLCLEERE